MRSTRGSGIERPWGITRKQPRCRVRRSITSRRSTASLETSRGATPTRNLVQETYTRAIAARAQFAPGTNMRAWLFRILRNAHIDAYRRARTTAVHEALDDDSVDGRTSPAREPLRGDAELERLRSVVTSDIEAALASLSMDARTIILLDLEGFTETELAEALGCAVGTVKSRLARARAILRERLQDYGS